MGKKLTFSALKEFLAPFRDSYVRSGSTVGELEYGIIFVAIQVSALDGEVTDDEVSLFSDFALSCPGASDEGRMKGRDFALRHAGYLELIAKFSDYTEDMRIAAFLAAVDAGLPDKFLDLSRECMEYAFVFWTAMAMVDGEISSVERRALEALKAKFDHERAVRKQAEIDNVKRVAAYSADYDKTIAQLAGTREAALKDEDFIARAEALLRDYMEDGKLK